MPPKGRRNTGGKRLPGQMLENCLKKPKVLSVKDNDDLNEAFIEQYKAWHVRAAEWVLEENGRTVDDYTSIEPAPVPDLSNEILPNEDPEFEGEMDLDKSESDLESSSNSSTEFGEQGDGEQSEGGQGDSE
ncbi:uncharacterized protein ATNIH1004_011835 [Aspergillus tanneri]|uniref:Uncharacterized protein n=1 Tax=Aspergillus tanneri TaxID=1220188 RepID=A0A5M9MAY9_9EURO|nr:uncharacterized protein ATNIH1004_011835 [Aspergillus tanneri]KAA8641699.1 hypothetical protein ATNIH1004_011835 [Aspergillus tanneri]